MNSSGSLFFPPPSDKFSTAVKMNPANVLQSRRHARRLELGGSSRWLTDLTQTQTDPVHKPVVPGKPNNRDRDKTSSKEVCHQELFSMSLENL